MNFGRNLALWVIIALLVFSLFNLFQGSSRKETQAQLAFSDFVTAVESGEIRDVTMQGNSITGHYRDGRNFSTYAPNDANLVPKLTEGRVRISALPPDKGSRTFWGIL
ncbi:MAG: ATP-dependent metallopeptidase FtsH/Yme1/Tma family protein, partial [Alphaproteobacteria bacterium]|nr:ATP-dependent metallopeptidase FtsH/Yme1/Tma family protein [Alphaproteobacteria bacterium]